MNTSILLCSLAVAALVQTSAGCGAGDGWTETYFRKCMKYVKTPIATWDAAQAKCKAEGGELATFEDQEQVDYVTDVRKRFPDLAGDVIWIGGRRVGNKWYWMNAAGNPRPMMITNWARGQPQSSPEDCLFLAEHFNGYQWHDAPCHQSRSYICQRPY